MSNPDLQDTFRENFTPGADDVVNRPPPRSKKPMGWIAAGTVLLVCVVGIIVSQSNKGGDAQVSAAAAPSAPAAVPPAPGPGVPNDDGADEVAVAVAVAADDGPDMNAVLPAIDDGAVNAGDGGSKEIDNIFAVPIENGPSSSDSDSSAKDDGSDEETGNLFTPQEEVGDSSLLLPLEETSDDASSATAATPTTPVSASPTQSPAGSLTTVPSTSSAPTKGPSAGPSAKPTASPSASPSRGPTLAPSGSPTNEPTDAPTESPTDPPSESPTKSPFSFSSWTFDAFGLSPTASPTGRPTHEPTAKPTKKPTRRPTRRPTRVPSREPTDGPTKGPTVRITPGPTPRPSDRPTPRPSDRPTPRPSDRPTPRPSGRPTPRPSNKPTDRPTTRPVTPRPTQEPTTEWESLVAQGKSDPFKFFGKVGEDFWMDNKDLEASGIDVAPDGSHLVLVSDDGQIIFLNLRDYGSGHCMLDSIGGIDGDDLEGVTIDPTDWSPDDMHAYIVHEGGDDDEPTIYRISYEFDGDGSCKASAVDSIGLEDALPCMETSNGIESFGLKRGGNPAVFLVGVQDTGMVYEVTSEGESMGPASCYDGGMGNTDVSGATYNEEHKHLWSYVESKNMIAVIDTVRDCPVASWSIGTGMDEEGLAIDWERGVLYLAVDGQGDGSVVSAYNFTYPKGLDECIDTAGSCDSFEVCGGKRRAGNFFT